MLDGCKALLDPHALPEQPMIVPSHTNAAAGCAHAWPQLQPPIRRPPFLSHLCCAGGWLYPVEQDARLVPLHTQGAPQVCVVHCLEHNAQGSEAPVAPVLHNLTVSQQYNRAAYYFIAGTRLAYTNKPRHRAQERNSRQRWRQQGDKTGNNS